MVSQVLVLYWAELTIQPFPHLEHSTYPPCYIHGYRIGSPRIESPLFSRINAPLNFFAVLPEAMAAPAISDSLWREAFGDEERPKLYSSVKPEKNEFAKLTSPKKFMKDLEPLSHTQLYAVADNCQLALKTAQEEYLHIETLIRRLEQKDPPSNPPALLDPDRFEEEKEATLYGYKRIARGMPYTRTKDGSEFYGFQEPFSQGGFVPTEAQYKRMKANAKDPNNIDDWPPIEKDGKKLIPRMPRSPPPRQRGFTSALSRPSRKRRFLEQGLSDTDGTAVFSDSDAFDTPSRHATRFFGRKIPPTRDPSETPPAYRGSPAPHPQHKFIVNGLTPGFTSAPGPTRLSTNSTPVSPERSPTPSTKRRRVVHNQNHKSRSTTTTNSRRSPPPDDPEAKKWTDSSLIAAINADHSFLHPDPAIARSWKTAILNAPNPVRSYAMKRKWAWWRKGGLDKRPRRGWREGSAAEDESQEHQDAWREGLSKMDIEGGGKASKLKKGDEEGRRMHDDRSADLVSAPPLSLDKLSIISNEGKDSNGTKQENEKNCQKDRQFTFKVDQPQGAPLPLLSPFSSSSSVWKAKDGGGGQGETHFIQSSLAPPSARFRTNAERDPPI